MADDVIFEEETYNVDRHIVPKAARPSLITQLVFKTGLAKTEKGAQMVLLWIVGICVVLSIFSLFIGGLVAPVQAPPSNGVPPV